MQKSTVSWQFRQFVVFLPQLEGMKHDENIEPGSTITYAVAETWTRMEPMYFLLKMGMSFQQSLCDRLPESL